MRSAVNRWQYVDLEADEVKAHTQGGCEGARRPGEEGGEEAGVGAGVEWDKEDGVDTD